MNDKSNEPPQPLPSGNRMPPKRPGLTARGLGDNPEGRGRAIDFELPYPRFMPFSLFIRILFRDPLAATRLLVSHIRQLYAYSKNRRENQALKKPLRRRIYFKLPLRQTAYHWHFLDRSAFLAGKLTVTIKDKDRIETLVVFENGRVSKGWVEISAKKKDPDKEMYFGFCSRRKYRVSILDEVELNLSVPNDLDGIGPDCRGILKAGQYQAKSSFHLYVRDDLAFTGDKNCEPLWDLVVTNNKGWMADRTIA